MISAIIRWSIGNRLIVLILAMMLAGGGVWSLARTPMDAIPDLSDVQVIIKTTYPGQAPQVVEDQVTYPLTTAMLAVPGAVTVRGYSFFNDSYVYIIFEDGTDLYWARSRVLEYLSQVAPTLQRGPRRHWGLTRRALAGSINTRWSTGPDRMISRNCVHCRTGS